MKSVVWTAKYCQKDWRIHIRHSKLLHPINTRTAADALKSFIRCSDGVIQMQFGLRIGAFGGGKIHLSTESAYPDLRCNSHRWGPWRRQSKHPHISWAVLRHHPDSQHERRPINVLRGFPAIRTAFCRLKADKRTLSSGGGSCSNYSQSSHVPFAWLVCENQNMRSNYFRIWIFRWCLHAWDLNQSLDSDTLFLEFPLMHEVGQGKLGFCCIPTSAAFSCITGELCAWQD